MESLIKGYGREKRLRYIAVDAASSVRYVFKLRKLNSVA
jgi:hypothetical protein